MMKPRCPICRSPVAAAIGEGEFPFCSKRCQLLDIGNWAEERYRSDDPVELPPSELGTADRDRYLH